jgi:hypothetical protein
VHYAQAIHGYVPFRVDALSGCRCSRWLGSIGTQILEAGDTGEFIGNTG